MLEEVQAPQLFLLAHPKANGKLQHQEEDA
jgi:hypothetical protein